LNIPKEVTEAVCLLMTVAINTNHLPHLFCYSIQHRLSLYSSRVYCRWGEGASWSVVIVW